jgi:hypothetical protein
MKVKTNNNVEQFIKGKTGVETKIFIAALEICHAR